MIKTGDICVLNNKYKEAQAKQYCCFHPETIILVVGELDGLIDCEGLRALNYRCYEKTKTNILFAEDECLQYVKKEQLTKIGELK